MKASIRLLKKIVGEDMYEKTKMQEKCRFVHQVLNSENR